MMRVSISIAAVAAPALGLVPTWVWAQGPSEPTGMFTVRILCLRSAYDVVGRRVVRLDLRSADNDPGTRLDRSEVAQRNRHIGLRV